MSAPANAAVARWRQQRERGSVHLLRFMAWLSITLGRGATRPLLYLIALYFFLAAPAARRAGHTFLARVLGRPPSLRERFRQVLTFATCIQDRLYLLKGELSPFTLEVHGGDYLLKLLAEGRGAFLLGAHLGSFEALRAVGDRFAALDVSMVMYEDNARQLGSLFDAINPAVKAKLIALGRVDSMLRVSERLDAGGVVGMLGDRGLGGEAMRQLPFFGSPAPLPLGPLRLAALTRRPVVFMAGLYLGQGRYRIVFEALADFSTLARGERQLAVDQALQAYAACLERHVRSAPDNWFNFYDFWNPDAT